MVPLIPTSTKNLQMQQSYNIVQKYYSNPNDLVTPDLRLLEEVADLGR
jgi:hypothetical protein